MKFIDMGTEHKVHEKCRMNIIIHLNKKETRKPDIRNVENFAMHVQVAEEHIVQIHELHQNPIKLTIIKYSKPRNTSKREREGSE